MLPPGTAYRPATAEQIARWIADLGTERSETATAALAEVGPATLQPLRKALSIAPLPRRQRIQTVLDRIEVAEALQPKRIHVKFEQASLPAVVRTLAEQYGISLTYNAAGGVAPKPITLELKDVPLWEALDRLDREVGLLWTYRYPDGLILAPAAPSRRGNETTYAGPFRVQAQSWMVLHNLISTPQTNDYLSLQLFIAGDPAPALLTVGLPRVVEARTAAGVSLHGFPSSPNAMPFEPLVSRYQPLPMKPIPKRGDRLKLLRGVLPVEVATEARNLLVIHDLTKAAGKFYPLEGGGLLHIRTLAKTQRGATIGVVLPSNALWTYDPSVYQFELTDTKGRRYSSFPQLYGMQGQTWSMDGLFLMAGAGGRTGRTAVGWPGLAPSAPG